MCVSGTLLHFLRKGWKDESKGWHCTALNILPMTGRQISVIWPKAGRTGTEAQGGNNESSGPFWHNYSIDGRKGRARVFTTCRSKVGFLRGVWGSLSVSALLRTVYICSGSTVAAPPLYERRLKKNVI